MTSTSFSLLAELFGVAANTVRAAARGKTRKQIQCDWPPFLGNPRSRERTLEDEVEMMEARVDCATYAEIAEDVHMSEKQTRAILATPSNASHDLFFRRNGYRFADDPLLALGKLTVEDLKRMLEMKYHNCTIERIATATGFSAGYVEQIVYGMRCAHKLKLAESFMEHRYGKGWKNWGKED